MSAVFMFLSMGPRAGGKLKQTSYFLLDTERLLFDFAKAVDHRRHQPEAVTFEWAEPAEAGERSHPERTLSRHDCLSPETILPGLLYLRRLALRPDRDVRAIWTALRQRFDGHPALEPGRFELLLKRDLDGLITFCEAAQSRGDVVVPIRVV